MRAWFLLHSLSRPGVSGREYARAFHCGLREVFCADRDSIEESAGQEGESLRAAVGADPACAGHYGEQVVGSGHFFCGGVAAESVPCFSYAHGWLWTAFLRRSMAE